MIRVALAELRQDPRLWAGPLLVAIVTGGFVSLAAVYWWTLGTPAGTALIEGFGSTVAEARTGSYVVYVCTGIPAIAVLGTSSAATVTALSGRIARWRLAGASSGQVRLVITVQILAVTVAGTILGMLAAIPFQQAAVDLLVRIATRNDDTIPVTDPLPAALIIFAGMLLVSLGSSFSPARRAARVPAVQAVRGDTGHGKVMPISRWIVASIAVFALLQQIVVTVGATLTSTGDGASASGAATLAMTTGLILIVVVAALAPILVPFLIRLWMSPFPASFSPSWFLARQGATGHPRRTAATVVPIAVGIALYGILFGILSTWQDALARSGDPVTLNVLDTYIMLTPAAVIAITGSIASVLLSTRARTSDAAMLRIAGASPSQLVRVAIVETVGYSLTALAIAIVSALATIMTAAALLTAGGLPATPNLAVMQMLLLAVVATAVLLGVLLIPAIVAARGNPRETISQT